LDEPTSALDAQTEQLLLQALERLMAGRTTLIIAHRLSTIRNADHITVLDHGQILEHGTHTQLLNTTGHYHRLHHAQNRAAASPDAPERASVTSDSSDGVRYLGHVFERLELGARWCYLAEDGTAHGLPREALAQACRECDVYFNLSNINWIDEIGLCRRRAVV